MMSETKEIGWDPREAEQAVKKAHQRMQAQATVEAALVELPVEQAHDLLRRIRRILWPDGPTEPAWTPDTVETIAATLNNRGLGLGGAQPEASTVDPPKREEPLTDEEYAEDNTACPYCYSGEIEAGSGAMEGDGAWQDVTCTVCGGKWTESYMLTGYIGEKDDDHERGGTTKAVVEVTAVASEVKTCPPGAEVTII